MSGNGHFFILKAEYKNYYKSLAVRVSMATYNKDN